MNSLDTMTYGYLAISMKIFYHFSNHAIRARLDSPTDSESTNRIKISICGQVFVTQEKTLGEVPKNFISQI